MISKQVFNDWHIYRFLYREIGDKKYISEKYMYKNGLELFEAYIESSITE